MDLLATVDSSTDASAADGMYEEGDIIMLPWDTLLIDYVLTTKHQDQNCHTYQPATPREILVSSYVWNVTVLAKYAGHVRQISADVRTFCPAGFNICRLSTEKNVWHGDQNVRQSIEDLPENVRQT